MITNPHWLSSYSPKHDPLTIMRSYHTDANTKMTLASLLHSHFRTSAKFFVFSWQTLIIATVIMMKTIIILF